MLKQIGIRNAYLVPAHGDGRCGAGGAAGKAGDFHGVLNTGNNAVVLLRKAGHIAHARCEVEQAQMERAIQNILVNAIRYSPSGELIRISLSETHGTIRVEIENTGVRVPDDAIPHLFEAFYRADTSRNRNTGGTGLGLYIVRKVMEMHRANYGISNINNGVLFWFELPCKQPVDNSI